MKQKQAKLFLITQISVLIVGLKLAFSPVSAEAAESARVWILSAKPSLIFGATGAGIEAGREVTKNGVLLANAELDHFLVGGTGYVGVSWRQFLWAGTFFQSGIGISETFFHSDSSTGFASYSVAGYEYQGNETLRPGVDILGYHMSFNSEAYVPEMLGFPKLRLTWRL